MSTPQVTSTSPAESTAAAVDNVKLGVIFALATALVGSSAAAAGKLAAEQLPIGLIVFVQFGICLLVILPRLLQKGAGALATQRVGAHLIRGFGGWVSFFAFYHALGHIPLVDANLLRNTAPLFVPLVVWLWAAILIPKNRWLPIIIGFVGVAIILRPQTSDGSSFNPAYLAGLASGALLAVSMVGTRLLSRTESSFAIMFYYFLLSFILSVPLAVQQWQPIPIESWPSLIYIGLSIFLAMWLYTKAYSYAKPSVLSPISYFSVVFSGLLGWVLWGHIPSPLSFVGIAIVVVAGVCTVYLGNREEN